MDGPWLTGTPFEIDTWMKLIGKETADGSRKPRFLIVAWNRTRPTRAPAHDKAALEGNWFFSVEFEF